MYADSMYSICRRFIDNNADAEEVLQDSFVKAFSNLKRLKHNGKFGGWIKRITLNECMNFINRKKVVFDELPENYLNEEDTDNEYFEVDHIRLKEEIAKLPEGCRLILNLYLVEDYKHKEIAKMLSISESTSKSQYQRAKQLLKIRLTQIRNEGQV